MIIPLKIDMKEYRSQAADLFIKKLPESQIAHLGYFFVRDVYFGCLLECKNFFCKVFLVNNKVGGFIIYTDSDEEIFYYLKRKCAGKVFLALIKGFFINPFSLLGGVFRYFTLSKWKKNEPFSEIKAEIFSLAVSGEMQKETDIKISNSLYGAALSDMDKNGVWKVKMISRENNLRARILNSYFGMKLVFSGEIKARGNDRYSIYLGYARKAS